MSCEFEHLDGAYVLGALAPAERQEFERHMAGCAQCSRAVQELAGMPGLLARVDAETLESIESPDIPVPDTLLPSLVREARRVGHRRTVTTALLSAAAVTVAAGVLVGSGVVGGGNDAAPSSTHSSVAATTRDMVPVVAGPVHASLGFVPVAWGTRIDMTCTYDAGYGGGVHHPPGAYVLVVRTRDGRTEQVAAWRALPGKTMRLSAATDAGQGDIASVEVRTAAGAPVLRLNNA